MGSSFTNYQVRSKDVAACIKAVTDTVCGSALVSDSKNGWITVYDEQSEKQNTSEVERIAGQLSYKLDTHVFAILLHDSDVFIYLLYHQGKRIDCFNSAPDYFGTVKTSERTMWAGDFEKLLPLATKGTTLVEIEEVFKKRYGFHEDMISDFAPLFGIDPERACSGFKYAQEEPHDFLETAGIGKPQANGEQTKSTPSSSAEAMNLMMKQQPDLDPGARKTSLESTIEAMAEEELPHVLPPEKIKTLMEHRKKSLERSKPSLEKMMKAQIASAVEAMAQKQFPHDPEKRKAFIEQRTASLEKEMKEQLNSSIETMTKEELP